MGINWWFLYRLRSMWHFFIHAVFQFTIKYRKLLVLRFSKLGLTFLYLEILTEILQNLYKFQFIQYNNIIFISNIIFVLSLSCNKYQKSKTNFKSSLNSHEYWDTLLYVFLRLKKWLIMDLTEHDAFSFFDLNSIA